MRLSSRFAALAVTVAAGLALAACQTPSPPPLRLPELTFAHLGPITLDVAQVVVEDQRPSALDGTADGAARVEMQAPTPPETAIRRWVADRLQPAGGSGTLRAVIKEASITETPLPRTGGLRGTFTNDQAVRFDGRIEVELVAERRDRGYQGFTGATVTRSSTLPENASLYERDQTLLKLVEGMMNDLNYRLETGALTHLSSVVVRR
ncbi:hypothetical protein [Arenibaculum sp.]|uniref:hypothetical protein n=1 Tax=Arenibaculum sp. TaxID=2865862 RepID=UPI002E13A8FC|nr:hypothetical protein [Arenibaculum sp.]